jgi:Tol biopolymer transport system component
MTRPSIIPLAIAALIALAFSSAPAGAVQYRPLLQDPKVTDTDPAPSPDGKWIAFQSNRSGSAQIWVMPAGGGTPRKVTAEPESVMTGGRRNPTRVMTPTWSPDSKSILFVSTRSGPYNIYTIPLTGGVKPKPLSRAAGSQRFPVFSPDGKRICFPSSRHDPNSLYGFDLFMMTGAGEIDGPPARQLTHSKGSPGHPVWSPDGKWIAYVAKDFDSTRTVSVGGGMQAKQSAIFSQFRVFKMPAGGGGETKLTGLTEAEQGTAEDTWPSWSPDGKWIAFGRNANGVQNVWVVDVVSRNAFPITNMGGCMKPTWSADGKSLYFARLNGRDEDLWVATGLALTSPSARRR